VSGDRFGPGSLRLCAVAAQLLGWRPDEFWLATPAELFAALMPPDPQGGALTRTDLNRLMERDHAEFRD